MRIRRSAVLAATLVIGVVPALGSAVIAAGNTPAGAAAAASERAQHRSIVAYWTPARMRAAVPRDFVVGATGTLQPNRKPPKPPPGGGGGGTGNTIGASWPDGKGAVYAATGKVYFEMGGGAWVCSGTALKDTRSDAYSLVITAGHCVYDEASGGGLNGFATNWLFIPQFDSSPTFTCSSTAFGCWTAQALVVNKGFASAGGFNTQATYYDWGFAIVGAGGKSGTAQLDATVPTFAHQATAMASNTVADAFGYPAAGKYHGNDLTYCQNPIGFDIFNANSTYRLACDMTGGSSGGPWLSGFDGTGNTGTIRSLNSYGYSGQTNMYGPIFNSNTTTTYNVANGSTTQNTIVN
jgi:hypothetical protein